MELYTLLGVLLPFAGTCFGSAWVLLINERLKTSGHLFVALNAFASGIMLAAAVWSLIIPAAQLAGYLIILSGILSGILSMIWLEKATETINKQKRSMLSISVAIHNFPEGMAVGAVFAALINGEPGQSLVSCMMLSVGIAVQNIPEGAIISMPLYLSSKSKAHCFFEGVISAVVELLGAVLTIVFYSFFTAALPFLLCFAAGAMIYAVIGELMPEISGRNTKNLAVLSFAAGFCIMMCLDMFFA